MPRTNPARRRALTDAAISLLASDGVHGLTHRSAERAAGLPAGTASNYFRNREELLVAAAERIIELHLDEMDRVNTDAVREDADRAPDLAELIGISLETASSSLRDRYLAIFELVLESRRRPALAAAMSRLAGGAAAFTGDQHALLGLDLPPRAAPLHITLYGAALFALVTTPSDAGVPSAHELARALVAGTLATTTDAECESKLLPSDSARNH